MYRNGEGVVKNLREARRWFEKAVAQGHEDAKRHLKELNDN